MSISSVGLYPQSAGDAFSANAGQQAKGALVQSSYQSSISAYGQIQNVLSSLQSSLGVQSALSAEAPAKPQAGYAPQESQLFQNPPQSGPGPSQIVQAAQAFVNAYNANGTGLTASDTQKLAGIGIVADSSGKLSLDSQTFQNALTSQPAKVAQVFSSIADSVRQKQPPVQANSTNPSAGQAQFASQSSSTVPKSARKVEALAGPNLAAQYSVISKLA